MCMGMGQLSSCEVSSVVGSDPIVPLLQTTNICKTKGVRQCNRHNRTANEATT